MKTLSFYATIFLATNYFANAQVITKLSISPVSGAVCPGVPIEYEVSVPTGFGGCKINWTAVNGTVQINQSTQRKASVTWNDTPGTKGKVTATFTVCGNSNNDKSASKEEPILSVKGQSFGSYVNSINVDYCDPRNVYITVPRMFVAGTGGFGQPVQQEVRYAWTLPAGWTTNDGLTTTTNYITIFPTKCAVPGIVKVEGAIVDRCGSSGLSAPATISLNGPSAYVTVVPQSGYTGATACNTTPVTFYATTNVGCATTYSWTKPASWTVLNQSANSITMQPTGSVADANPIKATVGFACGNTVSSGNYIPPYSEPYISGPSYICSSGSYAIANTQASISSWSSSDNSLLTINSSGAATRVGSGTGAVTITAQLPCALPPVTRIVWIGKPDQPLSLSTSVSDLCLYTPRSISINAVPGAASYSWTSNDPSLQLQNSATMNNMITGESLGDFSFSITSINPCGTDNRTYAVTVTACDGDCGVYPLPPCGPYLVAYPNPSSDQLTFSLSDEYVGKTKSIQFEGELVDNMGFVRRSFRSTQKQTTISIRELPVGLYYLKLRFPNGVTSRQIVKE